MAILNSRRRHPWRYSLLLTLLATLAGAQQLADEAKLEAIYLVKFIRFVSWPESALAPDQSLIIGVLGEDPFGRTLDEAVEGETVDRHPLIVRHIRHLREVSDCQVLYVSSSERSRLASILGDLKGRSVLTVSDLERFSDDGGIVRFVIEHNKLRFCINVGAARDANLSISSRLLELAEIVNGPKNPAR